MPKSIDSPHVQFTGLDSFVPYGINPLTGEACAFSLRILCDVNEDGLALLSEYWGVPNLQLAEPMNSQVNDKPSVGSVMLSRDAWRSLTRFVAARMGAAAVVHTPDGHSLVAVVDPEMVARYEAVPHFGVERLSRPAGPAVDSRHVHQFTGRVH